ncbi:MAG: isoprenylcysteine carboxylmethyltransferase family protein [Pseudomonadota bacterium]
MTDQTAQFGADEDRPNTILHPPTVIFTALIIGYVMRVAFGGLLPLPRAFAEGVGELLVIASVGVMMFSVSKFAEDGEILSPNTPSRMLIKDGPFRYSRNPIYLSMVTFGVGLGIATSNLWTVVTTVVAGVLFHYVVIPAEERYLEDKFGPAFEEYKNSVRRWM